MTKKQKLATVVGLLLLGGGAYYIYRNQSKPVIEASIIDSTKKEVKFLMRYKGMSFENTVTLNGIRRQVLQRHTFEAFTEGGKIILQIKAPDNSVLERKTIAF